jgi:hypothetical protein
MNLKTTEKASAGSITAEEASSRALPIRAIQSTTDESNQSVRTDPSLRDRRSETEHWI